MNLGGTIRINPMSTAIFIIVVGLLVLLYSRSTSHKLKYDARNSNEFISLRELLIASVHAAEKGGNIVKKIREYSELNEKSKGKTKEGANDPLTDGDMQSHIAMYYGLKKAFPNVNIISEEHSTERGAENGQAPVGTYDEDIVQQVPVDDTKVPASELSVWIDPLDATQEYTENLSEYVTTMVCVAVRGKPVVGVIHKPFEGKTYWAWAGPNYYSQNLVVPSREHSDKLRIIVSRSHPGEVSESMKKAFGENTSLTNAGGAGFKALEVIEGRQDAYIHITLIKKWDICAGNAILNAVNGHMTTLKGGEIDYSSTANVKNEGGLVATIHDHSKIVSKLGNI